MVAVISGDCCVRPHTADEKNAVLVDRVSRLSARFDQLEQLVQELVPHRPTSVHSAASAAFENAGC